jgi:hypothetical protein
MTMQSRLLLTLLGALLACGAAQAFEIGEFKTGLSRERVKQLLATWNFDQVIDASDDTLIVQDLPEKRTNRQWRLIFCNDKLSAFDQALAPSLKNLITTTNNYVKNYGQPFKVDANNHVLSNGEKQTLSMFWRVRGDIVGLRYFAYPNGEDLLITFESTNTCWQIPRP